MLTASARARMAEIFQDSSCNRWWLPNDKGFTKVLQRVRQFADDRNVAATNAQAASIQEARHVFSRLDFGAIMQASTAQWNA